MIVFHRRRTCGRSEEDAAELEPVDCYPAVVAAQPYTTARWRRARRRQLLRAPWCECDDCAALDVARRPLATVVHHRDGLGPEGPRGYDPANLQSMTKPHHDRVTAAREPRERAMEPHPGDVGGTGAGGSEQSRGDSTRRSVQISSLTKSPTR